MKLSDIIIFMKIFWSEKSSVFENIVFCRSPGLVDNLSSPQMYVVWSALMYIIIYIAL